MTDNPKSLGEVRFVGGPWDGMKVPWDDEPLPEHVALQKTPQGVSVVSTPQGEHVYDLASDEAGRIYLYAGHESHPCVCD